MKAVFYYGPRDLRLEDIAKPKAGEVRILLRETKNDVMKREL